MQKYPQNTYFIFPYEILEQAKQIYSGRKQVCVYFIWNEIMAIYIKEERGHFGVLESCISWHGVGYNILYIFQNLPTSTIKWMYFIEYKLYRKQIICIYLCIYTRTTWYVCAHMCAHTYIFHKKAVKMLLVCPKERHFSNIIFLENPLLQSTTPKKKTNACRNRYFKNHKK